MNALIRTRLRLAIFFGVMVGFIVLLTLLMVYIAFYRMIWQHEHSELQKLGQSWIESHPLNRSIDKEKETMPNAYFMTEPSAYGVLRHHFYIILEHPQPTSSLVETQSSSPFQADASWIVSHMQEALDNEAWYTLEWLTFSSPDQKNVQAAYAAMLIPLQAPYVLLVGEDISDYHMLLEQLKHRLTFSALLLLGLSAVIGYVFSTRAIRPLLEAHEKERSFLANASHELRTPLTVIGASLEIIEEQKQTWPEFYQEVFDDLQREVKRTQSIVRTLFELSRLEHTFELAHKPVHLYDLLQSTYRMFQPIAQARGITLINKTRLMDLPPGNDPSSYIIQGDETMLSQLLTNLLDNALKFTPSGRRVFLYIKHDPKSLHLCVEDEGPGMDEETKKNIFERFYRANPRRDPSSGAGLGMALVKMISDLHQAHITIESTPGQGTTICVAFHKSHSFFLNHTKSYIP